MTDDEDVNTPNVAGSGRKSRGSSGNVSAREISVTDRGDRGDKTEKGDTAKVMGIPSGLAIGAGGAANGMNFGDGETRDHTEFPKYDENILLPTSLTGERCSLGERMKEKGGEDDPFIKYLSGVVDEDVASKVKLHWIISGFVYYLFFV